jgi:NADPH:quinone reductase-like Zn-dependent oxidoreductase
MTSHSIRRGAAAYASASPKLAIQWISTRGAWLLESLTKAFAYIGTMTKADQSVAKVLAGYSSPDLPVATPTIADLQQRLSVVENGQLVTLRDELYRHVLGFQDDRFNVDLPVVDATMASLLMHLETVLAATSDESTTPAFVSRYLYALERAIGATNARLGCVISPATCSEWGGHLIAHWQAMNHAQVGHTPAYSCVRFVFPDIGAFSEYLKVPATKIINSPEPSPALVPLTTCGVSASLALEKAGEMKSGETVFVSAAAGATGQFAVQLAKLAGNHVIGACSSDEKVEYLKSLGVDRPINYRRGDLNAMLKKKYPNGIDLAFEGVGGDMFKAVLDNIAIFGRIIVFGNVSHYHSDAGADPQYGYVQNRKMQLRSPSLRGFQRRYHHPKEKCTCNYLSHLRDTNATCIAHQPLTPPQQHERTQSGTPT